MSSLGIFDKETKTYKKVADLSKAAAVDDALSQTSTNPVQNKVVTSHLTDLKYNRALVPPVDVEEKLIDVSPRFSNFLFL